MEMLEELRKSAEKFRETRNGPRNPYPDDVIRKVKLVFDKGELGVGQISEETGINRTTIRKMLSKKLKGKKPAKAGVKSKKAKTPKKLRAARAIEVGAGVLTARIELSNPPIATLNGDPAAVMAGLLQLKAQINLPN